MIIALTVALLLSDGAQTRWRLPVTIRVTQDVPVSNSTQETHGRQQRGSLYVNRNVEPFVIKKGRTFQMIKLGSEGSCRIRFDKREYEIASCPWLDGSRDHQTDIYTLVTKR